MTVPWDRGYRKEIKVKIARRGMLALQPSFMRGPLDLGNPPMNFPPQVAQLDLVLESTRTILVNGCFVLDPPRPVVGHTCFVPARHLDQQAAAILSPRDAKDCAVLHWRWFNETDDYQHYWDSCKLTASAAAGVLRETGFTCLWVISDAPSSAREELQRSLHGVRFTRDPVNIGSEESFEQASATLRAVVVDDSVALHAGAFVGNPCSTMSSYIMQLRLQQGKDPGIMHHRQHVDLKLRDAGI